MSKDIQEVMSELDKWVSRHGNGQYLHSYNQLKVSIVSPIEETIGQIFEEPGIQQVREEIKEFASVILSKGLANCVLEVGLGRFASTHFLWRQIFNKVVTIEQYFERVRDFGRRMKEYYGEWVIDDGKSFFIDGSSHDPKVVMYTYKILQDGIDVLFLDGDHTYQGVLADWLLYNPLVKPGGIVAFHDSVLPWSTDVPLFLKQLETGKLDGKKREFQHIMKSNICGIGYYTQGE